MTEAEETYLLRLCNDGKPVYWLRDLLHFEKVRSVMRRSTEPGLVAYVDTGYVALYNCNLSDFALLNFEVIEMP